MGGLTRNIAFSLLPHRIRVNGLNIGWMDTPAEDGVQRKWHGAGDDWLEKAEAAKPFGSLVKPVSVAGLISYLLSAEAGVLTGSIIDFDQHVNGATPE